MSNRSDRPTPAPEQGAAGDVQRTLEDVLGFNLRSVRTLRDLILRPRAVFESYAERDPLTYTRAIRIFLGLVGLQVLVAAVWGGWHEMLRLQITSDPAVTSIVRRISGNRLDAFVRHYSDAVTSAAAPLLVAGFSALSVVVLHRFRRSLAWSSRLNIAMGILSVGALVGLLVTPLMAIPGFPHWSWTVPLAVTGAYLITFARGAPTILADTARDAWLKGLVYATALLALVLLAGVVLAMGSTVYAIVRLNSGG